MRFAFALVIGLFFVGIAQVHAQEDRSPTGEAHWILERLTGVHWASNSPLIQKMAAKISAGDTIGAADIAASQPQFFNITVKNMALKMSTREETVRLTLNDFAASFIGVTRDQTDARQLLSGNFYYAADPALLASSVTIPSDPAVDMVMSNRHYDSLAKAGVDFSAVLKRVDGQKILIDNKVDPALILSNNAVPNPLIDNPDPAGVLTSFAWMQAHATAGTNRRLVEFTFREFMCIPLIHWADTQAPDVRVGRDVDRFPGGDNVKFQTTCKGCHSQQDGFRGAFAKWDYRSLSTTTGIATYGGSGGQNDAKPDTDANDIQRKLNQNGNVYSGGYVTVDDSWVNNATRPGGPNAAYFGWRGANVMNGRGTKEFGALVANSQRFSLCLARHVFDTICKHKLSDSDAQAFATSMANAFEGSNYNLKKLFETVAIHPKCRM